MTHALLLAVLLSMSTVASAEAGDAALDALMAEYWDFYLAANPVAATRVGVDAYNDRFASVTPDSQARQLDAYRSMRDRLADLDRNRLTAAGRVDAEVFAWVLDDTMGALEHGLDRLPFNTFSGFFMNTLTANNGVAMKTADDFEVYLTRLGDLPRYFAENIANMRRGAENGFVLPQIVIDGVLPTLEAQIKADPEDSSFFQPLEEGRSVLPAREHARLTREARELLTDEVFPAFAMLVEFLRDEYAASTTIGAFEMPGGSDYYAFQIRRYTTLTDIDAGTIHAIGLDEVARIRAEMLAIIEELEFDGDFAAFTEFLRTDPQFYAESPMELLKEAAWIAKRIDYVMPGFFGRLPRQSYGIVAVPDEIAPNYTTGAYVGAPQRGVVGGAFWLNTHALDQRPLYELPSLTLHEAVPGHHHQSAIAAELDELPAFRRELYFSAFGEGWALYTEKLGVEMGIYQTPYEHFGRLSYEMWRACRLVIDTGIHAMGWSREEAIAFMTENTGLSAGNIRAEIDRYISWPGQALAYKLGELEIWELRRRAEDALGDDFDIREFHDVLLINGALPLAMLEGVVERYIDSRL